MTNDTDNNNEPEKLPANVAKLPNAPAKPDPLLEEINVVRLEGRYFCFDKHEAKKRNGTYHYLDESGTRETVIEVDPRVGHPSILAYKILQAAFRKITLEGKPYPDRVAFRLRELGRLVGRDIFGGQDSKDLYQAIRQLRRTEVRLILRKGDEFMTREFSLVIDSGFIGKGNATDPSRLEAVVLRLHPAIMDSMRAEHFAIFNWERVSALEPLTGALFKRLFLHLSNLFQNAHSRKTLKFEKSYIDICAEWLGGLKPERYKSRIEKQLNPHFRELQQVGLIRSVGIEIMADGRSFKLVFTPGAGFFYDYETFYIGTRARVLQFTQAADAADINAPLALTTYFYTRLFKNDPAEETIYSDKDIQYAQSLIKQFGEAGVRDLIDFAIEQAKQTHFEMQTIHAVRTFVPRWQTEQVKRARRLEDQKVEAQARHEEQLLREYNDYCDSLLQDYLGSCSPEELEEIQRQAEEATQDSQPLFRSVNQRLAKLRIARERCTIPTYEAWLENRK